MFGWVPWSEVPGDITMVKAIMLVDMDAINIRWSGENLAFELTDITKINENVKETNMPNKDCKKSYAIENPLFQASPTALLATA